MPPGTHTRWIILGAFLVVLGVLFLAVKNYWISTFGFLVAIIGIGLLVVAIPKSGQTGQSRT